MDTPVDSRGKPIAIGDDIALIPHKYTLAVVFSTMEQVAHALTDRSVLLRAAGLHDEAIEAGRCAAYVHELANALE